MSHEMLFKYKKKKILSAIQRGLEIISGPEKRKQIGALKN